MRVLHIIGNLNQGGAEAMLASVVRHPSHIVHHVVSIGGPAFYSEAIAQAGVQITHLNAEGFSERLRIITALASVIRASKPHVVQSWMYRSNFVGGIAAKLAGVPIVWGIHCAKYEELPLKSKIWVYLDGAMAGLLPSHVINCSAASARIHERVGFGRAHVEVIPNGYDLDTFRPDAAGRTRLREEFGIGHETFLIGSVGRWHPQKDQPNLVRALGQLKERVARGWRCLLVGFGLDGGNAELLRLLRSSGVEDHVICAGRRSDVADVMRGLDLHVLSSAEEAFPNVVAEAMASETPCVVTDVGDAAYMAGDTGWVVPPKAPLQLAQAIGAAYHEWYGNPAVWEARRTRARARVAERFTLDQMVARYGAIWEAAARSRG